MNYCEFCKHSTNSSDFYDYCYNCVGNHSDFEPIKDLRQVLLNNGYVLSQPKKITRIVLGFPGVGKTYVKEHYKGTNISVLDSDSSNFDKDNFPENYINYIKSKINKYDLILISTHDSVRKAILKDEYILNNAVVAICYPTLDLKEQWLIRLANRGNSKEFISLIDKNYEKWIKEIESENWSHKLVIDMPNWYLLRELYKIRP